MKFHVRFFFAPRPPFRPLAEHLAGCKNAVAAAIADAAAVAVAAAAVAALISCE